MIEIPQDLKKKLKETGFDIAEQQVVFYLFKHGLSSVANISKGVRLPRSTINLAVDHLLKRKVLNMHMLGKRRMIYIEKPHNLRKFIEHEELEVQNKLKKIDSLLPELRTFFSVRGQKEKIDVEFLDGEDGFVETFFRSLEQEKGGEVLRFGGKVENFTVARQKLKKYGQMRRKKKIFSRIIVTESPKAKEEVVHSSFNFREARIIPESILNPNLQVSVWKNHVALTIWDEGLNSIIITNKSIYEFMKMLFELVWRNAK